MPDQQNTACSQWRSGRWAVASVVGLAAALIALGYIVFKQPGEIGFESRTEEGFLEQLTHILYGVALVICLAIMAIKRWPRGIYPAIILAVMLMRELDFHIRFSPENTSSIRFWKSGEIALWHKLLAAAVLIALIVSLVKLLRRNFRPWLRHLKLGYPYAISIAGAITFVLVSYLLDDNLDMDALDNPVVLFLNIAEESIEVGIPILLGAALIQWAISSRREPAPSTTKP